MPIGIVRSTHTSENTPKQGFGREGISRIVIFDEYSEALEGVERFEKLFVIYLTRPAVPNQKRANPIGISVVKVVKIDGNALDIEGLDAIDGTPIIDIKPYYDELDARRGD